MWELKCLILRKPYRKPAHYYTEAHGTHRKVGELQNKLKTTSQNVSIQTSRMNLKLLFLQISSTQPQDKEGFQGRVLLWEERWSHKQKIPPSRSNGILNQLAGSGYTFPVLRTPTISRYLTLHPCIFTVLKMTQQHNQVFNNTKILWTWRAAGMNCNCYQELLYITCK